MQDEQDLSAGDFSAWLKQTRNALQKNTGIDVPCGTCTACCKSSYFIHIRPEEKETLAKVPKELQFPAPGFPKGHVVLGFDEKGHCPMLKDNTCSIYEYRPLTCRTYDCRVFPATGLTAGGKKKVLINQQVKRWQFNFPSEKDHKLQAVLKTATKFLLENAKEFPKDFVPSNLTQVAILAIKVHEVFLRSAKEKTISQLIADVIKAAGQSE